MAVQGIPAAGCDMTPPLKERIPDALTKTKEIQEGGMVGQACVLEESLDPEVAH